MYLYNKHTVVLYTCEPAGGAVSRLCDEAGGGPATFLCILLLVQNKNDPGKPTCAAFSRRQRLPPEVRQFFTVGIICTSPVQTLLLKRQLENQDVHLKAKIAEPTHPLFYEGGLSTTTVMANKTFDQEITIHTNTNMRSPSSLSSQK